ncbi:hypothetical protein M9H77_26253 [Catharanthus roseus]|uniref:Uncharacterized protein n=1 Tax=Catharanthus roseus TaxID=4058 RepID=A0ACC0A989_CATRO|nr:hypothetical protein M9H77_26253 [Catharanthus roseus]
MYEISQIVDLPSKVDVLSKKFDQLLALNTLSTNSPNVQDLNIIKRRERIKGQQEIGMVSAKQWRTSEGGVFAPRLLFVAQVGASCVLRTQTVPKTLRFLKLGNNNTQLPMAPVLIIRSELDLNSLLHEDFLLAHERSHVPRTYQEFFIICLK